MSSPLRQPRKPARVHGVCDTPVPHRRRVASLVSCARMLDRWLPFLIYGFFALAIPCSMIAMSFIFATRPAKRPEKARTLPFESGVSLGPPQQNRFTVSFYLTAMLFILFDIEIVF